ncbi:hypothetical protein [Desulfovibrio sp.]|uniref:hypothetical protein n=1 Tax=Desulfovibrio sp. TaxID=885 RepID=UPI0035B14AA0
MSGQKNAYFANSPNTSHRLRFAAASLRKATPRPAFDAGRQKAETPAASWAVRAVEKAKGKSAKGKMVRSMWLKRRN